MDRIIAYIKSTITKINEEINNYNKELELLRSDLNEINSCGEKIQDINFYVIEKYLRDDKKDSDDYKNAKYLIKFIDKYPSQSQIITARNYLEKLKNQFIFDMNSSISQIEEKLTELNYNSNRYSDLLSYIENYSYSMIFDQEYFDLLNEVIKDEAVDEDIIDFYMNIGTNNALNNKYSMLVEKGEEKVSNTQEKGDIEKDEEKEYHVSNTQEKKDIEKDTAELDKKTDNSSNDNKIIEYSDFIKEKENKTKDTLENIDDSNIENYPNKEQLRNMFKSFPFKELKNHIDKIYFNEIISIRKKYDLILNTMDEKVVYFIVSTIHEILNEEDSLDLLEILDKDQLLIGIMYLIIKSYENNDINTINKAIAYFKNHYSNSKNNKIISNDNEIDFEEIDKSKNITSTIDDYKTKYDKKMKTYHDYVLAFKDSRNLDSISFFNQIGISKDELSILINLYNALELLQKIRDNNNKVKESELQILQENLDNLEELEKRINNEETELFTLDEDKNEFKNYIVFLDKDGFIKKYEEIMKQYNDVKISDLINKIKIIKMIDIDAIQNKKSKKLKIETSIDNPYDIREINRAKIRLYYKVVETCKIDGHNVILICGIGYGNIDSKMKNKNIQEAFKDYNPDAYEELKSYFNNVDTFDELSDLAKDKIFEGEEFYSDLCKGTLSNKILML